VSLDVLGMFELREDHLGKDFSKFDAHLVCGTVVIRWCPVGGREEHTPKELIPQITPWPNILCSYNANMPSKCVRGVFVKQGDEQSAPRTAGVISVCK
jgi:hypothetical protein